jgi:hypothetical protein
VEITIVLGGVADKLIALGNIVLPIFVLQVPLDLYHHHLKERTGGLGLGTCVELNFIEPFVVLLVRADVKGKITLQL